MGEKLEDAGKVRASFLSVTETYRLNVACAAIMAAFDDNCPYLVGSSLHRADYRDVDLRLILDDADYDRRFGSKAQEIERRLLNVAISDWIAARTGLPIDFQFQRMTDANARFDGPRNAMGFAHVTA